MEPGMQYTAFARAGVVGPVQRPARTWAGQGRGAECSVCGGQIAAHEVEYEVELPEGSSHFHFACYRTWAADHRATPGQGRS
jgi:hypothetical protein